MKAVLVMMDDAFPGSWSIFRVSFLVICGLPRGGGADETEAFSEEQIASALRQGEAGAPVKEIIRRLGVTEQTFYRWKKKYAGMGVAEVRKLKSLEEENRRLKQLVADLTLDKAMLQDVLSKRW